MRTGSRAAGVSPGLERLFADQVRLAPHEAAILRLPPLPRPVLFNGDGEQFFVVGISDPMGVADNHVF